MKFRWMSNGRLILLAIASEQHMQRVTRAWQLLSRLLENELLTPLRDKKSPNHSFFQGEVAWPSAGLEKVLHHQILTQLAVVLRGQEPQQNSRELLQGQQTVCVMGDSLANKFNK